MALVAQIRRVPDENGENNQRNVDMEKASRDDDYTRSFQKKTENGNQPTRLDLNH